MTPDQEIVLLIKGAISELSADEQTFIFTEAAALIQRANENELMGMVVALVGAELAAK